MKKHKKKKTKKKNAKGKLVTNASVATASGTLDDADENEE